MENICYLFLFVCLLLSFLFSFFFFSARYSHGFSSFLLACRPGYVEYVGFLEGDSRVSQKKEENLPEELGTPPSPSHQKLM